jgi:hypothetical protein
MIRAAYKHADDITEPAEGGGVLMCACLAWRELAGSTQDGQSRHAWFQFGSLSSRAE